MTAEPLRTAADAVADARWADAATHLLDAWQEIHSERIARVLAGVDLRLPPPAPLEGKLVRTREEHWHALVATGEPEAIRRALAAPWPTHPKEARARVTALSAFVSARVSNALLAVHRGSQYVSREGVRLSRAIFQLLIAVGDHAAAVELERLARQPTEAFRLGASLLRRKRPVAPVLDADSEAALARIEAALVVEERADAPTRDNLLAAIYAAPGDDAPRVVYADVLTEAGDARGEFITLQLQGCDVKRQQKLLRAAGRAWFDGLDADGAAHIIHRRGFPAEATLGPGEIRGPAWATIEVLRLVNDGTFSGAPHLRALRALHDVAASSLATMVLPHDELDFLSLRDYAEIPESRCAPRLLGLSRYAWLQQTAPIVRSLVKRPLARRVETVRLPSSLRQLPLAIALARDVPFAIELMGGWWLDVHYQWAVHITPQALTASWHGTGPQGDVAFESIVPILEALPPPAFETLEVTGSELGLERVQTGLLRIIPKWPNLKTAQIFGIRAS